VWRWHRHRRLSEYNSSSISSDSKTKKNMNGIFHHYPSNFTSWHHDKLFANINKLKWYQFALKWISLCDFMWPFCVNLLWHMSHSNGLSPVCVYIWVVSLALDGKILPHMEHMFLNILEPTATSADMPEKQITRFE
jgi:hypothetical protein